MMEEIDRNNLPLMQKIAEEQQVAHLQCAHVQAVKWLIQNRLSNELSCESASAYFHAAKHQLSEVQLEELQSLMKQSETENIEIVLARISHLLQDYPDLHQGFGIFLPPDLNLQMQTGALSHFDMKNKNENTLTDKGNISIKEEMMDASSSNETNSEVLQESFKNSLDKENDSIFLTKVKENMNGLNNTLENSDENCYSPFTTEPLRTFSPENDSSDAPAYSYGIYEQHLFFDKMKEACGYPEVYDNFLRFLNLYNEDYVTKSQLVEMVKYFFGGRPDLYKEFKDILGFNESGENIEAIPMKVIALENERKKVDPNGDIDFTTGGNGASYRPLSDNYDHPKCSGRTALCNEVLNDKWVSFPSSSEATFPKSCKTEYEEAMHRFEDELFELDIAKRDNKDTIHILEDLNRKLNKMTPDNRRKFILDEYLGGNDGIVQKRAFQRLMKSCQEHPRECNLEIINFIENSTKEHLQGNLEHCTKCLINSLMQNPAKGVPIILKGLNTSEKELNDLTDKFNEVWKKQLPQLVLKSKDTLGVNFRQKDPKSFQPKSLMTELEIIYIESKANQTFVPPHFKLHLKKREVFLDAINLILEYLKKLPGIFQDDKHKIELVICNFIPDFFCTPFPSRCADAEKEKIKSKLVHDDNNCGGRNCQNSCTCNIRGSSDQEKFNEENEEKNEKDNSIFKGDVFDKINTLPKTNMPYTVFFVNKTWFIFFRQSTFYMIDWVTLLLYVLEMRKSFSFCLTVLTANAKLVHDDNNCGGRNCQNSCTCNIRGSSDQEKFNEENEEKNEKDNSIFKGDVFDKINTLPKTNMPYTVFFVNKTWFIFFRQSTFYMIDWVTLLLYVLEMRKSFSFCLTVLTANAKLVHDDNNCGGRNCQNSCTCNIRGSSDQEKFNEENEEKNEKDNSIFKGDVFDKINTLPKTNMPYTVFFANKTWFIFFRQFYILYDRLAELLSKSRVLEVSEREIVKQRPAVSTQMLSVNEPWKTYPLLIDKLHKLMNGTLDYAQFEEEARSLYKIHAYISYTMDKLIHAIIRQVQHILTDDACKDCTALFLQHMTMLSSFEPSSFIETSQIEHEYQRKAERMLGNERCLKVAWHNNIHTLAIEILEQESDRKRPDPREAEIRSNYFDAYIREESCYDEILFADEVEQLPVILPRNLRKQQLYWKNKAIQIEKLHLKRQTHMKKRQPLPVRKRKSVSLNIVSRKRTRHSIEQEDSLHSSGNGATLADDYEANYDNDSFKSLPVDVKVMDEEGITNDTEVSEKFDIPNKNDSVHNKDEEKRVQTKVGTEEEKEVVENERIEYEEIEGNKSMIENEEEEHKKIDMFGESKCLVIKSKMICDDITDQSEESREVCMANEPEESERKLTEGTADQSEESKEVYMANEPEESERKIIEGAADQSDECTESECKESEKGNSFYEFEESEKNLPLTQQSMEKHLSGTELEAVFYNIAALCSSDYSINVSEKESEGDKIIENETTKLMGMEEKEIGCDKSKSLIKKSYMGIVQKIANQFEESEDIGNSIVESKDEEVIDYYKKATEDEYENEMRKIDEFHKLEILAKESEEMNDSINESAESDDETVKDYEKKAVEEDEVVKSEVDTCDASKNRIKNSEKKNVDYPVDKSKEPEEKISNDLAEVFKESEEMIGESAKYFEESIEESHYVSSDSKNSEEDNILADKLEGSREETADVLVEQPERTGERVVGNIKVQEVESAIDNGNAEETKIKKSIDSKYESACKVSNDVPVKENKIFEDITIVDLKPETIKNPKEIMKNEKNSCSVEESEPKSSNANVSKGIRERKKKRALSPENVSKTEIDLQSGMSDIQVVDRVLESTNGDDQKEIIVDSFSIGENKEESPNKMPDKRPSKLRKNRTSVKIKQQSQSNMKRKAKKAVIRNTNKKRRRQIKPKCEFLDDASFDFIYFFKLPEEEKVTYLALYYMTIDDDEQVFFNKTSYRMNFIQNRNLFLYRKNTLPKAKEIHQAVSEIKTSNFNAWHSLWLEKHVTPSMLKSCNEWLLKTERNRFISQRITVSEYAKPPYIPYYKYMVRYYQFVKDEKEEEMNTD
ncbi:hypothetical protein CDAR_32063 [Caerostris darwini]|uniref:Histone deacetylase interacting domain-containing protein n=1 Tax=Caerostris darwini TaxID=1538125 RepID=A0AAV4RQL0_9ARAC|nr:hypothetical protein CDAR_32063 [Caerostris darwini]